MSTPPTRPVTITSPGHAVGITMILTQTAIAVQLLLGTTTTTALIKALGSAAGSLLPALMLCASLVALSAAVAVSRARNAATIGTWLAAEALAKAVLGAISIAYAASLTLTYGWSSGSITQTYAWALGLGFCARAVQVWRDRLHLRRAAAEDLPATPPPLGEPATTRG
ncbi:hypothetical protein IEE94_11245 [Yimella sp. cx-573]|nr:hypothetical protein [Yimella sp. cx-573]